MFLRHGYGFHHLGAFHWLVLAVVVVLLVAGVIALVRLWNFPRPTAPTASIGPQIGGWSAPGAPIDPALGELRMRYARGELSFEEYLQRAANLGFPSMGGFPPDTTDAPPPPKP